MKAFSLKNNLIVLPLVLLFFVGCNAQTANNKMPGVKVKIETTAGDITVLLYNATPKHQQNFVKLVNEKYFDGMLFHRVIKDFMIQAGDPDSKTATKGQQLGSGGPGYTIDAEFNPELFHKKGALAAARTGDQMNPEKKSSGSQFYIVQGKTYTDEELQQMENQMKIGPFVPLIRKYIAENADAKAVLQSCQQSGNQAGIDSLINSITEKLKVEHPEIKEYTFSKAQKDTYKTVGGTPFLDGGYTVFGEVLEGLDVVDKIAQVETDQNDRPVEDVKINTMKLLD